MNIFEIVTGLAGVYTFRYVEEGINFLYEVFCGVGDCVWGGGVFCSKALCGDEGLYELVLRPYDVRDWCGAANRRFQTNRTKAGHRFNRYGCAVYYYAVGGFCTGEAVLDWKPRLQ